MEPVEQTCVWEMGLTVKCFHKFSEYLRATGLWQLRGLECISLSCHTGARMTPISQTKTLRRNRNCMFGVAAGLGFYSLSFRGCSHFLKNTINLLISGPGPQPEAQGVKGCPPAAPGESRWSGKWGQGQFGSAHICTSPPVLRRELLEKRKQLPKHSQLAYLQSCWGCSSSDMTRLQFQFQVTVMVTSWDQAQSLVFIYFC